MAQGATQAPAFPGITPTNEPQANFFTAQRLKPGQLCSGMIIDDFQFRVGLQTSWVDPRPLLDRVACFMGTYS